MVKSLWVVVLAAGLAGGRAWASGEAIPLVPIDTSDAGRAEVEAPRPPPVVITVIDAGPAVEPAIPLVAIVDAGPSTPALVDAGSATPAPLSADAGAAAAPAPDAGPSTGADGGKPEPENPNFVKGELSQFLGANRIAVQTTRVGVGIGVDRIDSIIYALLEPRLDLHLGDFGLGLAVPLNLEVFNAHLDPVAQANGQVKFIGTKNLGHVRTEDYQTARDYARVLQYLTYGKKEDHLYIDIGQIYSESLGHGEIMRRYQPNIDLDIVRLAAEVDAYNDYAGAEVVTNDLLRADIVGGLIFVKPLSFITDDKMARSFSVGATYAMDRTAPSALSIKSFPGSGLNGCDCRPVEEPAPDTDPTNPKRFVLTHDVHAVSLFGVDAEVKVLKTDDVDVKPFFDFSHLNGGDSGITLGVLGRLNFLGSPITPTHAVRLVLEARYLGDRYRPEYFDTFYEVDKYIFLDSAKSNVGQPITQQQAVLQGFGNRVGYYAEASYAVVNWVSGTLALEGDSSGPAKNLIVHVELPKLFLLQLFGTYYKRGFDSFSTLTQLDKNSVAFAGARIEVLPILYVNGRAYQTFQLDAENTHSFQTTRGVEGDVELGWQF